jgi:hypothetical protein
MSSIRKEIREKITEILTGNTDAGTQVFKSRTHAVDPSELPAILVYSRDETVEIFNAAPRELKRSLTIGIEIAAKADEDLDDTLDDLSDQVEALISENQTLSDTASDIVLQRVELHLVEEGNQQHGACVMTYLVTYYTMDVSLGVAGDGIPDENVLGNFETANIEYKVYPPVEYPPGGEQPSTVDTVTLPT